MKRLKILETVENRLKISVYDPCIHQKSKQDFIFELLIH
jgi:hypothetical protein